MPMSKAEKAADRLLQKLDVTIESKTFIDYRKIVSKVTITEGLIHSKGDDGDADDEADDGAVGAVKLSLNSLNHLNDLSEGDCQAERAKIRQQLVDGGIPEEHADAIMRIVPYGYGAHPKRAKRAKRAADVGETHKYPTDRKVAVASNENNKKTRTKVDDHSELLNKLQHSEDVSNRDIMELLKAQQSKPPGPSHKKKEKESGEEDSEMADDSGGANEGGESRAQEDAAPLTLDTMLKVFMCSMGPSSNCDECGCVITDEAMRNVGTLPMTTRCLDCHKKQGNVAAATTICYSKTAASPVTWVKGKPIELKPTMCKCGTSVAHDAQMTTTPATCTVVHMLPFLRQQEVEVHSCTCSNIDCKNTVVATLKDAGGLGLLWFAGSLDKQDPLMLDLNSGKKQWFVSMPDIAHLNEVRMLTKCALKKWVEACYETAVHFGWSAAEMLSDETISHLLMALLVYGKLKIDVRQEFALPDVGPCLACGSQCHSFAVDGGYFACQPAEKRNHTSTVFDDMVRERPQILLSNEEVESSVAKSAERTGATQPAHSSTPFAGLAQTDGCDQSSASATQSSPPLHTHVDADQGCPTDTRKMRADGKVDARGAGKNNKITMLATCMHMIIFGMISYGGNECHALVDALIRGMVEKKRLHPRKVDSPLWGSFKNVLHMVIFYDLACRAGKWFKDRYKHLTGNDFPYILFWAIGAMHALQHTELCRLLKGQFAMACTAYSQGDAPEAVMRGMNTARYILRYLSPVKHFAHLEQLIHSWNRTHRRQTIVRLSKQIRNAARLLVLYSNELVVIKHQHDIDDDQIDKWLDEFIAEAKQSAKAASASERPDPWADLAQLKARAAAFQDFVKNPTDLNRQVAAMDITRFNNLQNKSLALNMKNADRVASDAQKLETTMRKEIAADTSVAVADRNRVFSDKLSEAAIRLPALRLIAISIRLAALRDDFLTKWKAVYTPQTAVPGTVCSSGSKRLRSLQRAHHRKAGLELEEAVKIYNSVVEECNSGEPDSTKHSQFAVLTDCKDVNYKGVMPWASRVENSGLVSRPERLNAVMKRLKIKRLKEELVLRGDEVRDVKEALLKTRVYMQAKLRQLLARVSCDREAWGRTAVLQSELKVITDLQKEWDDAFAHWQCFADGADSESDSDDEADPHGDDESDSEERAYADEF